MPYVIFHFNLFFYWSSSIYCLLLLAGIFSSQQCSSLMDVFSVGSLWILWLQINSYISLWAALSNIKCSFVISFISQVPLLSFILLYARYWTCHLLTLEFKCSRFSKYPSILFVWCFLFGDGNNNFFIIKNTISTRGSCTVYNRTKWVAPPWANQLMLLFGSENIMKENCPQEPTFKKSQHY